MPSVYSDSLLYERQSPVSLKNATSDEDSIRITIAVVRRHSTFRHRSVRRWMWHSWVTFNPILFAPPTPGAIIYDRNAAMLNTKVTCLIQEIAGQDRLPMFIHLNKCAMEDIEQLYFDLFRLRHFYVPNRGSRFAGLEGCMRAVRFRYADIVRDVGARSGLTSSLHHTCCLHREILLVLSSLQRCLNSLSAVLLATLQLSRAVLSGRLSMASTPLRCFESILSRTLFLL